MLRCKDSSSVGKLTLPFTGNYCEMIVTFFSETGITYLHPPPYRQNLYQGFLKKTIFNIAKRKINCTFNARFASPNKKTY